MTFDSSMSGQYKKEIKHKIEVFLPAAATAAIADDGYAAGAEAGAAAGAGAGAGYGYA